MATMSLRLVEPPAWGTMVLLDKQEYLYAGTFTTANGRRLNWLTHCPDCGRVFAINTTLNVQGLSRRCVRHAQPGKRVPRRGRGRRVAIARTPQPTFSDEEIAAISDVLRAGAPLEEVVEELNRTIPRRQPATAGV